ncbi:MAG: ABC transporter substrate-binding protein, partial [Nonomuraea sp.]|nr:ABC transporter substrate-binding protein [Nonomuraea sp.]
MNYTHWAESKDAKSLFTMMDEATKEPDQGAKKAKVAKYIDFIAEQAVLYPVVHNELMTAWDPKKLSGIRAQPYPGINLLQAKRT